MIRDSLPFVVVEGIASLDFRGNDSPQRYDLLLVTSRRLAFENPEVRRIEVQLRADDKPRRRALHRAGFRLEGVLRDRLMTDDGVCDVVSYGLLRTDDLTGRSGFTSVMNSVTARKRVISHLLLTDAEHRICVLETTFKPDFELPGGILEPGESPRAGLVREIREELSHTMSVGRLLVVDWLAPCLGW